MSEQENMIDKRTWEEFREAKLLWWINRILHTFGWVIIVEVKNGTNEVTAAYPARTKFRGFTMEDEEEGFIGVTQHLASTIDQLVEEVEADVV